MQKVVATAATLVMAAAWSVGTAIAQLVVEAHTEPPRAAGSEAFQLGPPVDGGPVVVQASFEINDIEAPSRGTNIFLPGQGKGIKVLEGGSMKGKAKTVLAFAAAVFLASACSRRGPIRMTDADLGGYHVGTLPVDACAAMGVQGPCVGSVADIISGQQSATTTTVCPPHCSIEAVPLPQNGPVTITQDISSNGTRIIQRNSWTPTKTDQSILVLPRTDPQLR